MAALALSGMQAAFVEYVVQGETPRAAALKAGYRPAAYASQVAHRLMVHPRVSDAIRRARLRLFESDMVPTAVSTLRAVMLDKRAPAAARVRAAQVTLQAADYLGRDRRPDAEHSTRSPSEMTLAELEALAAAGRAALQQATATVEALQSELGKGPTLDASAAPALAAPGDDSGDPWS